MKRAGKLGFVLLLMIAILTGCWDQREPNQLAFINGAAMDLTKDGKFEISSLLAIPAVIGGGLNGGGDGGNKKSFHVVSATGKDFMDAGQNLQTQLSRQLFYGHRQTILVGQRMAEYGIASFIDMVIRNPQSEMRSTIYVVKDGDAKDLLSMEPIFDPYTSTELVSQQDTLQINPYYYRNFLSESLSQGTYPLLPAVSMTPLKKYVYTGSAILNKDNGLKLAGFLNTRESFYANWITGKQKGFIITSYITQGNGNISLNMQKLDRRIRVNLVNDQIQIEVRLVGKGSIVENNATLDPTARKDLQIIQDEFNLTTQNSVQQLIDKVQKEYKTDIFGFGEVVHRKYPKQWKNLEKDWSHTFSQLQVSVKVDIHCKEPGQTTSSIMSRP
ncbi:Ger(x)C family spore germination protein [Paenibacillus sp. GCM10023248]|uniref:Ger(x)C family spore germination protein n=1 Tax=Bacillales TaxID=1385 RepID=UPI002379E43E|nr:MULTISPECIES: Ger(x)C family spore germination protein [Bacillales]MDD9267065.1 Ger(x)C family spore germination protein [Paenibacillus sp. MAHUQ-63]MDR6881268.1 spore germination protein KC [Bacillus sp. 3255]